MPYTRIAIPSGPHRGVPYWQRVLMEIPDGEAIRIPFGKRTVKSLQITLYHAAKRLGIRISAHQIDGHLVVWRRAKSE